MFWANGPFSKLESLCARSFIQQGYALNIWTYGGLDNAPARARIRDARDVLSEDLIFLNSFGSIASFADLFRYALLSRHGGLYADTDVLAIAPASAMPAEKFLVSERVFGLNPNATKINGNVIFNPSPSEGDLVDLAYVYSARFRKTEIKWGELGPDLLTAITKIYPGHGYQIMAADFANPFDYWTCLSSFFSEYKDLSPAVSFLHLYNEVWRRNRIDKEAPFPPGSFLDVISRRIADR